MFRFNKKAVLTIETALILPLFVVMMVTLISLMTVFYAGLKIETAVNEEAKLMARNLYDDSGYNTSIVETDIYARLGSSFLNSGMIVGGASGLDFTNTDLTDKEIIRISVKYGMPVPFGLLPGSCYYFEKSAVCHSWTGYVRGLGGFYDSEYVYMTENGTVYHKSRECSHIRLRIIEVSNSDIAGLRNSSGGKYKRCIYCRPDSAESKLYITEDGDRYHGTLNCSGLKRSVYRVRLSETGGIRPCARCGY